MEHRGAQLSRCHKHGSFFGSAGRPTLDYTLEPADRCVNPLIVQAQLSYDHSNLAARPTSRLKAGTVDCNERFQGLPRTKMARTKSKATAGPEAKGVESGDQLATIAAYTLKFLNRTWFGGRFDSEAQPYMVRLLVGIFLCYEEGALLTKKQARECMQAVDGRTSQRYLSFAEKEGLLTIVQSSIDRRVDLLCPTELLLSVVESELSTLADELIPSSKWLENVASPSPAWRGWRGWMVSGQVVPLTRDQLPPSDSFEREQIAQLTETIRLAPKNAAARNKRAYLYICFTREYDKAIADLSEAIRLKPNDHHLYYWRANSFDHKKDFDRAIADYSEAIRLEPTDGTYYKMRALAYVHKGDRKKAQADWRAAAKRGQAAGELPMPYRT
jgi:tetratricopeptide (TPR) repeat protein